MSTTVTTGVDPAALPAVAPLLEAPAPGDGPGENPALATLKAEITLAERHVEEAITELSRLDRRTQQIEHTMALDLARRDDMKRAYAILKEAMGK